MFGGDKGSIWPVPTRTVWGDTSESARWNGILLQWGQEYKLQAQKKKYLNRNVLKWTCGDLVEHFGKEDKKDKRLS